MRKKFVDFGEQKKVGEKRDFRKDVLGDVSSNFIKKYLELL